MNELLLSLLVSVLRQGSPIGLPGGIATRPLPPRVLMAPATPRSWPVAPSYGRDRALQHTTLAALYCLGQDGRISGPQTRTLIDRQGDRRGWPAGWERQVPARDVGRTIGAAGGCRPLLARLGDTGVRRPAGNGIPRMPSPGSSSDGRSPGSDSRSEAEGFGLAPYR